MWRDRVGIIHDIASRIAELQGNIADLSQTVVSGYFTMILVNDNQYMMILQVDLSRCASLKTVQRKLLQSAQKSGIKMVLQHNDIFQAMHEITMPGD